MPLWTGHLWSDDWFDGLDAAEVGGGEMLALTNPERVRRELRALLEAGADAISTITFGALATTMAEYGMAHRAAQVNYENARLARATCQAFGGGFVLGSMGPSLHPLSLLGGGPDAFARMELEYREQAEALVRGGVDVLHLEHCLDMENLRAAMAAIGSLGAAPPVMISAQIESMGTMLDGTTPVEFVDRAKAYGARYVGISGHMHAVLTAFESLTAAGRIPDALLVDTFQPGCEEGWLLTPESLAAGLSPILAEGPVPIIGIGCAPRADFVAALQK